MKISCAVFSLLPSFFGGTLCLAGVLFFLLGGCALTTEEHDLPDPSEIETMAHRRTLSDEDHRPLLPRQSNEERWRELNEPLPPLPDELHARPHAEEITNPTVSLETESHAVLDNVSRETKFRPTLPRVGPEDLGALVDSYQGKVLLLNFWGIDCGPCIEELPALNKMLLEFSKEGLAVAAVNTDVESRWRDVERFVGKQRFAFDVYLRSPGSDTAFRRAVDEEYSADPFTVIFDKEGKTIATISEALPESEWRRIVAAVLGGRRPPVTNPDVIRLF